jgi:cysteine-rich repeat protein
MSKGSWRQGAPWIGAALLGAGAVSAGACGGLAGDELFNSGATSGAPGTGGEASNSTTMSTSSTASTMATSSGQGGDSTSTASGPGGAGGASASSTSSGLTTSSTSSGGPGCGDGIKQMGEQCDQMDFGTLDCTSFMYSNPAGLVCTPGCKVNFGLCKATCDGVKAEPGEVCDGAFLNGHDCTEVGFSNPAGMTCAACQLDSSGCAATCDGAKLETGETCDGAFLNGHTCIDLGYSKGDGVKCTGCQLDGVNCKTTCGDGKLEPTEQCDDGNVNSGDGCDATCHTEATAGTTCSSAIPISVGLGIKTVNGTTTGGGDHTGSCTSSAPDRIYKVTVTASGFLTANLVRGLTSFDSVLYIAKACSDVQANQDLLCADSYDTNNPVPQLFGGEVVSVRVTQGQTYYIFVDGFNPADLGSFQITFDLAKGNDCFDPVPITLVAGTSMTVLGSTPGTNKDAQGTCGGNPGEDVVYQIIRPDNGPLDVDTDPNVTNYNSALYARSICASPLPASELACSNNTGNAAESLSLMVQGGVNTYVWVDGSQSGGGNPSGNYGLILSP